MENVNWRAPLNAGITKIGEMDLGDLVGDLSNLTFEKPQAKRTGFSAHDFIMDAMAKRSNQQSIAEWSAKGRSSVRCVQRRVGKKLEDDSRAITISERDDECGSVIVSFGAGLD